MDQRTHSVDDRICWLDGPARQRPSNHRLISMESVELISTRPARFSPRSLEFCVVRPLEASDLDQIINGIPKPLEESGSRLLKIRASHHKLAECIVQGMEYVESSMITGYSPGYITQLKSDPTFMELLADYDRIRRQRMV